MSFKTQLWILSKAVKLRQFTSSISIQNKLLYFKVTCYYFITIPFPHALNHTAGFTNFNFSLWLAESNWQAAESYILLFDPPKDKLISCYFQVTKLLSHCTYSASHCICDLGSSEGNLHVPLLCCAISATHRAPDLLWAQIKK